jgi:hypothetical protein
MGWFMICTCSLIHFFPSFPHPRLLPLIQNLFISLSLLCISFSVSSYFAPFLSSTFFNLSHVFPLLNSVILLHILPCLLVHHFSYFQKNKSRLSTCPICISPLIFVMDLWGYFVLCESVHLANFSYAQVQLLPLDVISLQFCTPLQNLFVHSKSYTQSSIIYI